MQNKNLIDSLLMYQIDINIDGKVISVKVTVKNFEPLRIEPAVKTNDDLMLFMNLKLDQKKAINKIISDHMETIRYSMEYIPNES